jgi:hypothetical protein
VLLLRQTVVPLREECRVWLRDTRRTVRRIVGELRRAGFPGGVLVLQWLSLEEGARILATWPCRYIGDVERYVALTRVIERYRADRRFLASHVR